MRKKPRPDGIIAWLPDRLARNMRDAGEIIELLDSGQLADLKFPMYAFHNDSSGKEHLAMEFARAKAYSDHLQDNVLRGLIEQELKGRGTRPLPPAYTVIEDEDSAD
jgi:DNA invertase Pin-like site-specific DNA recombinase